MKRKPLADCQLYTFVDTGYLNHRPVADVARQLIEGGADLIQLRAKDRSKDEITEMAEVLIQITEPAGVWLVINDHPHIAHRVKAPLCHLGQEDFFDAGWTQTRAVLGGESTLKIGLSTHAPEQAARALNAGADYVAIGPVYPTATKPGVPPVTLDYVRWAAAEISIPWFAIGGITLRNVDAVLEAGARRICVVSAILDRPDVARACQQFRECLRSAAV
jgi:thiamine-phosphate pyrophosphorylase